MFGYINVNKDELSEENVKIYQSYYCGLCQKIKSEYGRRAQMALNYDMTFLIVLLTGLYEPDGDTRDNFVCVVHPTRKRTLRMSQITDYAAAMNILLAYYNLIDDWNDDRSFTKKTFAGVLKKDFEKAKSLYPRQAKAIADYIKTLAEYEQKNETNIDVVSGLTGEMLGEVFAWKKDEWYHELKNLGYYLGKFIYIMDAYEDIEQDIKKNSYNPLTKLAKCESEDFDKVCSMMMTSMLSEAAKTFERLPILLHADIIRNVLYSGVWSKYEYIQMKKRKKRS